MILVGGGEGSPDIAIRQTKTIFSILWAKLDEENIVMSMHTDHVPAAQDEAAMERVKEIAKRLNTAHEGE